MGRNAAKIVRQTVTETETPESEGGEVAEEVPDSIKSIPLFATEDIETESVAYVTVSRLEPSVETGFLDRLPPNATDADLLRMFGGGRYTISARNSRGAPVKGGAMKTLVVAGDPIFKSQAAVIAYKRQMGIKDAPVSVQGEDVTVALAKIAANAEAAAERRERERDAEHKRQLELVREDAQRRERENEAANNREIKRLDLMREIRETELKAQIEREKASAESQRERDHEAAEQSRQRDRDFQATMMQIVTSQQTKGDPVETLLKGLQLGQGMNPDGGNVWSKFIEHAPDLLAELRETASDVIREAKGNPTPKRKTTTVHGTPTPPAPGVPGATPPAANPAPGESDEGDDDEDEYEDEDPNSITLTGEAAVLVKQFADHFVSQGVNPVDVLKRIIPTLIQAKKGPPPPIVPPAPEPVPMPAKEPTP